jgi:hypothetical protein
MSEVIVSEFVTLDGVMEDPGGAEGFEHGGWSIRLSSEEQERFKFDELTAAGALMLGRNTYEGFAAAWPHMMDRYEGPGRAELQEYTDMMNGYPKHVVSRRIGREYSGQRSPPSSPSRPAKKPPSSPELRLLSTAEPRPGRRDDGTDTTEKRKSKKR